MWPLVGRYLLVNQSQATQGQLTWPGGKMPNGNALKEARMGGSLAIKIFFLVCTLLFLSLVSKPFIWAWRLDFKANLPGRGNSFI